MAKTKAEIMREMRKRRKERGLSCVTYWLTTEQIEIVENALKMAEQNAGNRQPV